MAADEGAGGVERLTTFIEHRCKTLENVGDCRPDLKLDGNVVLCGSRGQAHCVIEEDFVGPGLDEKRCQASEVGENGTGQRCVRSGSSQIVGCPGTQRRRCEGRVHSGLRGHGGTADRQVSPGGENRRGRRLRQPGFLERDEGGS